MSCSLGSALALSLSLNAAGAIATFPIIDHVVPLSRGGPSSWENCVLAHREVNSRKGDRLPQEIGLRLLKRSNAEF